MAKCGRCGKPANGGMFPLCDDCAWGAVQKLTEGSEEIEITGFFTPPCDCFICRRRRAERSN